MTARWWIGATLAALVAAGCTLDAVFDFGVHLGPTDELRVVVVEAATTEDPFGAPAWAPADLRVASGEGTPVTGPGEHDVLVSVVTEDEADHARPLRLRVRLCRSVACRAPADERAPQALVEIERAFYEGEATSWTLEATDESIFDAPMDGGVPPDAGTAVDAGPAPDAGAPPDASPIVHPCEQPGPSPDPSIVRVPRCQVRGCLNGSTACFCRRDGTHYCE